MSKRFFWMAFALGLAAVGWVGAGFAGSNWPAFAITTVIAAAYLLGGWELRQHRADTAALAQALDMGDPPADLPAWLDAVPRALRAAVRQRVEQGRGALPGPALTPALVGLLVMLGMLGTFIGMVVTFRGAVFALEGSTDLQAIRAALAEPIRGLGLSFGTSVAGVAASAMLGLMAAIARRERLEVARRLDACANGPLRAFSQAHQRELALDAARAQATALPAVVDRLQALADAIERRGAQVDARLEAAQAQFHREATAAYGALAREVGESLRTSLADGAHATGERIAPVIEAAVARIAHGSATLHARLADDAAATQARLAQDAGALHARVAEDTHALRGDLARLAEQLQGRLAGVADGVQAHLTGHAETLHSRLLQDAQAAQAHLTGHAETLHARLLQDTQAMQARAAQEAQALQAQLAQAVRAQADALADAFRASAGAAAQGWEQALQAQARQDSERLQAWGTQLQATADALQAGWQQVAERGEAQARRAMDDHARLLAQSDALLQLRAENEARWLQEQRAGMAQLAEVWRTGLQSLREDEQQRGELAVQRLGTLEATVADQLARLGQSLEAPLARLLQTASEVPQAAAGVLAQLRAEMGRLSAQENAALAERAELVARLGQLAEAVEQSARQSGEMAAHVNASAIELASWGEAFGQAVQTFHAGNEKLAGALQQVEAAMARSTARSDEQLAYYVAQAREVIDLSIASQHGVIERLRELAEAA